MRRVSTAALAGLLLLALLFPQPALADPEFYEILLVQKSGFYRSQTEVSVSVNLTGTYYLCWNTNSEANQIVKLADLPAGNSTAGFTVPEAKRGAHKVILTDDQFRELASEEFRVTPTVHFGVDSEFNLAASRGPEGTEITIRGYGFTANESNIPIRFDGGEIRKAKADPDGSWEETYKVPKRAGDDYVFEVGPDSVEQTVWTMRFTVTPTIKVSPTSGVSGQMIEVTGTGFAANEKGIRISFGGEVVKEDVSAGADGSFKASDISVPRRAGGTYKIGASGFFTLPGEVPLVDFTIKTGVSVSPDEGYVGDPITVTGSGFAAWEQGIKVTFDGKEVDTGVIQAEGDGTWQASFIVPASTFGAHTVSAYGDKTGANVVQTATVKTLASLEVSPAEGAPGDSVTLTGSGFPGNGALTVNFANRPVSESVQSQANGNLSFIVKVPASPATRLDVTATGGGAQATTSFTVTTKTLDTPQPVLPEEGRRLRSGEVEFEWGRITAGSEVTIKYTLRITGPGGSQMYEDLDGLSFTIPAEEALRPGQYEWQVKSVDQFENESEWSEPMPFRVSPIPLLVWVAVGLAVFTTLMVVAYREDKFRLTP